MTLNGSWQKSVTTTVNKTTALSATVVEAGGAFVVNVANTITDDANATVVKLIGRFKITPVYSAGNNLNFTISSFLFPGSADNATVSSAVLPPDAQAVVTENNKTLGKTGTINLTDFYTAAGDIVN